MNRRTLSARAALMLTLAFAGLAGGTAPPQTVQIGNQTVNLATLPLVPPEAVPRLGTFFSIHRAGGPPLPGLPLAYAEAGLPVYWLGGNRYLVDDTSLDWSAIEAERRLAQAAAALPANSLSLLDGGGAAMMSCTYGSNDLWLELVAVTNGTAQLLAHTPEPEGVFDLFQTPSLATNAWAWIARGLPGQTQFSVTNLPPEGAFYILGTMAGLDTNGVTTAYRTLIGGEETLARDTDGDDLPDVWEILHFGNLDQGAVADYDGDGVNNRQEFENQTDPNKLRFLARFSDLFVNTREVMGTCEVQAGVPAQLAVLVNDTNLAAAQWVPFSPAFAATLPNADGDHTLRIALRGRAPDAVPVWDDTGLTLDRVPPVLVVTNPVAATATVGKPWLQLQGLADEPLAHLSYDLSNALRTVTGQSVAVVDQAFDTNRFDFTTNWFQGYDVRLATNVNHLTLRVADRAGNVTTTNLTVTLDYSLATNAPVLTLRWPTNGMHLSGERFQVRGAVSDETARVNARIVDAAGVTNEYVGVVERTGRFWVENLPLTEGTNTVLLVAANEAGLSGQASFSVVRSDLALAVTYTPTGQDLYAPRGTVCGTVSDPACAVSVNGVAAAVYEGGGWVAEAVPIVGQGTAMFDVVAAANDAPAVCVSEAVEMPAVILATRHVLKQTVAGVNSVTWLKDFRAALALGAENQWRLQYQGRASTIYSPPVHGRSYTDYEWSDTDPVGTYNTVIHGAPSSGAIGEDSAWVKTVPDEQVDHISAGYPYTQAFVRHSFAKGVRHEWTSAQGSTVETLEARTRYTLYTGGKAELGRRRLHRLGASLLEYLKPQVPPWTYTPSTNMPPNWLSLLGQHPDADGAVWVALNDGTANDLDAKVNGAKHTGVWIGNDKYKLGITANYLDCRGLSSLLLPTFIVGQYVTFRQHWVQVPPFSGTPPGVAGYHSTNHWSLGGNFYNDGTNAVPGVSFPVCSSNYFVNSTLLQGDTTTAWWVSGGFPFPRTYDVSLDKGITFSNGQHVVLNETGSFNMCRPDAKIITKTGTVYYDEAYGPFTPTLHYGQSFTGVPGILFSNTIIMSPAFPNNVQYTSEYVQVIYAALERYQTNETSMAWYRSEFSNVLDTDWPYGFDPHFCPSCTSDSPRSLPMNQYQSVSISARFGMWLEFKPTGGQWVPLRKVDWGWGASVGAETGWQLTSTNSVDPTDLSTEMYPHWTNVWSNANFPLRRE